MLIQIRVAIFAAAVVVFAGQLYAGQLVAAKVSVCFTPSEQCEGWIVDEIDKTQSSIRVQAYGFTSLPIIDAL